MRRQEEAERELAGIREAARTTANRRASLLDVCASLELPFGQHAQHAQHAQQAQQALPPAGEGGAADAASPSTAVVAAAVPAGEASEAPAAAADAEWRTTRLECLMYRVLWVSEAIQMFAEQYSPRAAAAAAAPGGTPPLPAPEPPAAAPSPRAPASSPSSKASAAAAPSPPSPPPGRYELFLRASSWARQLSAEHEESIRAYCCELERLRARLRDAAAVDLGYEIGAAALEYTRRCGGKEGCHAHGHGHGETEAGDEASMRLGGPRSCCCALCEGHG